MLKVKPRLRDLLNVIDKVPDYPVTSAELVELAADCASDPSVPELYLAFPADETFTSKEDLITRTEQVVLMNEEQDQPLETWHAPEED